MNLLDLPDCMIEQIFEYLSYDEIARKRLVCTQINKACQRLLNRGFTKMMKRHTTNLKRIKAQLPRRESERRNHPLARHADILTCIETRISMLSMTYTKYMELNLCCFIPGKVIDEVLNILRLIETTTKPLRAHEVLQELRDISSMAIEHFDEKIANLLKKSFLSMNSQKYSSGSIQFTTDDMINVPSQMTCDVSNATTSRCDGQSQCQDSRNNLLALLRMEDKYKKAIKKFNQMIQIQNKQMRHLRYNSLRISQLNSQIGELKRRLEESDAKNREISANISQITYEAGSTSTANSPPKPTRNIKPRAATIILKRRITEPVISSSELLKKPKLDE